jgi:hypothetical protein
MTTISAIEAQIKIAEDNLSKLKTKLELARVSSLRDERTKLKWISNSDPETYRVAVVTKDGVLEVKRVTNGGGYCHDTTTCKCVPCAEIRLSTRLGAPRPPWIARTPLLKTFFENEMAWRDSLPEGGSVTITLPPQISDKALNALCKRPLKATTDALRLKELEKRFPGAKMVLTTESMRVSVQYVYEDFYADESANHMIACECCYHPTMDFAGLGVIGKPQLSAEWRGRYIDLSNLF